MAGKPLKEYYAHINFSPDRSAVELLTDRVSLFLTQLNRVKNPPNPATSSPKIRMK
jgi:hypothetical protein